MRSKGFIFGSLALWVLLIGAPVAPAQATPNPNAAAICARLKEIHEATPPRSPSRTAALHALAADYPDAFSNPPDCSPATAKLASSVSDKVAGGLKAVMTNGWVIAGLSFCAWIGLIAFQIHVDRSAGTSARRATLWAKQKSAYIFNEDTGEWRRKIRRALGGGDIVVSTPRKQRVLEEEKAFRSRHAVSGLCHGVAIIAFLTSFIPGQIPFWNDLIAAIAEATAWAGSLSYWLGGPQLMGGIAGPFQGAMVVDPPAREWFSEPFGPGTTTPSVPVVEPPGPATDSVDLTYRPNV